MGSPSVEVFGGLILDTGGVNGYEGVRKRTTTKKGEKVVEYQGYTPTKHNTTAAYKTEHDAAVARAVLKENLRLGLVEDKKLRAKKSAKKRAKRGCRARSPPPPPLLSPLLTHAVRVSGAQLSTRWPASPRRSRRSRPRRTRWTTRSRCRTACRAACRSCVWR